MRFVTPVCIITIGAMALIFIQFDPQVQVLVEIATAAAFIDLLANINKN